MSYSMVSNTYNMAFRTGAGGQYPLITNSGNPKVSNGYVLRGTEMTGVEMVSVGTTDKWMHVTAINGQACDGYVAQIYLGYTYCVLSVVTDPTTPPVKQEITSVTLVPHYSDGTSGVATEYYPVLV